MATISKRVTSKGKAHYRVQVRLKGYPERTETFDTKKEAEDWAKDVESGLKKGRLGIVAPDRTFAELLDRFEEKRLEALPHVDHGYRGHLQWWRQELGEHFLRRITTAMVREAKQKLLRQPGGTKRRRGRATVNRYMTTLSTVFTLGVRLEWIEHNVVRRVEKEEEPRFVPLAGEAAEIVERRLAGLRDGCDLLFAGPGGTPRPFPSRRLGTGPEGGAGRELPLP